MDILEESSLEKVFNDEKETQMKKIQETIYEVINGKYLEESKYNSLKISLLNAEHNPMFVLFPKGLERASKHPLGTR